MADTAHNTTQDVQFLGRNVEDAAPGAVLTYDGSSYAQWEAPSGGSDPATWTVDENGNVTFATATGTTDPVVTVKGRPSGYTPLVSFQDNEGNENRVSFYVLEAGAPDNEADTYQYLSCGDGAGADDFALIDINLLRKGSINPNGADYPGFFIEMQGESDTSGFLGIGAYRHDRDHKAMTVDWATGRVRLQRSPNEGTWAIAMTVDEKIGFFSADPVVKPTGVAVTAAGIHAALVSLGLIAA